MTIPITGKTENISYQNGTHSYFEISPGVYVFRVEQVHTFSNARAESYTEVAQGVTDKDGITALESGLIPKPIKGMLAVDEEYHRDICARGYRALADRNFRDTRDDIYDFIMGGGSPDHVFRFFSGDHTFWKVDGSVLPTGLEFGYIDSHMHNQCYNLRKALETLQGRDDVVFAIEGVATIPSYNRESGKSHYLSFFWRPSQEQADIIQANYMDRYRIVFDHDMIGLRAAGAALYDNFFKHEDDYDCDHEDY